MACALPCLSSCNSLKCHTSPDIASLHGVISGDCFRISERKKKRPDILKQTRRSFGELDSLPDDFFKEIKPYSRAKDFTNRACSSNDRKEIVVLEKRHTVTQTINDIPYSAGNLPAFDVLDKSNDLFIRGETIPFRDGALVIKKNNCTKNTKNLESADRTNNKVERCTVLNAENETCQSIRNKKLVGNRIKESSCNQIKQVSDPFIGGHHLGSDGSLSLSNSCGDTVPLHDFADGEDIVGSESETLILSSELDIFSLPNKETGMDSRGQISIDSTKQIGGLGEEQAGDITLENTLIDLGIDVELEDLTDDHKSDETSDLEDSEEYSSEEDPADNNDSFQADLDKLVDESISTKSITPLIKKELQYKIQCERLERGDGELKLESESPIVYKLTDEEIRKKNNRREQNRRSAIKARARAKEHAMKLKETIQKTSSEIENRLAEREKLKEKKSKLLKMLTEHMSVCKKFMIRN